MRKKLQEDPKLKIILITGAGLFILAIGLLITQNVRQNLSGEAFYDFAYPATTTSWFNSIKIFFIYRVRSRLTHAVFVTLLYKLFGYNPPLFYTTALLMVFGGAMLAALTLRDYMKNSWEAAWLTLAFSFIPLSVIQLFSMKKLHHALSWLLFWLAIWLCQKWIKSARRGWLVLGLLSFTTAILAYEAVAALLPLAIFLSNQHLKNFKDLLKKTGALFLVTAFSTAAFLGLEIIKPWGSIFEKMSASSANKLSLLPALQTLPRAIWQDGLFSYFNTITPAYSTANKISLSIALLFTGIIFINLFRTPKEEGESSRFMQFFKTNQAGLLFAGGWLTFATYIPFILAGQRPDSDNMLGAAQALILISFAAYLWARRYLTPKLAATFLILTTIFWMGLSIDAYATGIVNSREKDQHLYTFIYTLKQEIPSVKEKTTFVFLNASVGRTGCIGLMNMLYNRQALHCVHLLDGDKEEGYIRQEDGLLENVGNWFGEDYVIVTFDEHGTAQVIDNIYAADYPDIPVIWESDKPLQTNTSRIIFDPPENDATSSVYEFASERQVED